MTTFAELLEQYDKEELLAQIMGKTAADVENALCAEQRDMEDFKALISPAAVPYLENMAQLSHESTLRRFGNTIQMYAPIYMSNECSNGCVYCGFNSSNTNVVRKTLTLDEIEEEAKVLNQYGYRHVLLLTGEDMDAFDNDDMVWSIRRVRPLFSSICIEVYPMDVDGYKRMVDAGVDGLTIYQETYDKVLYKELHKYGRKRDFLWRLGTPERGAEAGMRKVGIGALLGLGNFYTEAFFTALHAHFLFKNYWRTQVAVSFPRIRPAAGGFQPLFPVSDAQLVQAICAMRLLLPDAGLTISTRESAELRDHLLLLGITQMSAGSSTAPGGYAHHDASTGQFNINDDRTPAEIAQMLHSHGYESVWKDWDPAFMEKGA